MSETRPLRILNYDKLKERGIDYTRVHLSRLEAQGRFPRKVRMSANRVGWVEDEIDQYLRDRINARNTAA